MKRKDQNFDLRPEHEIFAYQLDAQRLHEEQRQQRLRTLEIEEKLYDKKSRWLSYISIIISIASFSLVLCQVFME